MKKLITQVVKNTCAYIEEACKNFSHDIRSICDNKLVEKGSKLQTILPLDSDPHNGLKVALCFEFESSNNMIYKPRSLELDKVVNTIFTEVLSFEISPVATTFNKGEYGWQSFIQQSSIEQSKIGEAFYNLGLCAAVFSCLGATDLHDENIIYDGTFPYFVDLETSLSPSPYRTSDSLIHLMGEAISNSVVSTSILPAKVPTFPHQILVGAINTPYPQETNERMFNLRNAGTDAIDIAKENVKVTRPSSPITLVNDELLDPLPFQPRFVDGYTKGYKKVMRKRKQICSVLLDTKCPVRVILRPTGQYALLLDACLFPENLIDDTTINRVLGYLKPSKLVEDIEIANELLKKELDSIKNGDIPYFYVKANDLHLKSQDFVSGKAFNMTPAENAVYRLENMSENKLIHDKRLIAEGYSEIRINAAKHTDSKNVGYLSPLFCQMFRKVRKDNPLPMIDLIKDLAITTESTKAHMGWLGGIYGDSLVSYDSIPFISLHDTGGILFLLEHLCEYDKTKNKDDYIKLFEQANRGLKLLYSELSTQLDSVMSIISGASSIEYIFNHKEDCLKKTVKMIEDIKIDNVPIGDVYLGPMSIALLLSTFPNVPRDILKKFNTMFSKNKPFKFSKEGIAHGKVGAIWTQFRLSYALENIDKAKDLFKQLTQYSTDLSGWCNGNAGLLMVLSEMASVLNERSNFYEIARKAALLPEDDAIDLSICHGVAGVLQSLLFAYTTLGDTWYLSLANQYWEKALQIANKNGFYTGEKNRDYLLGYFLGWSGVADSALLLQIYNSGGSSFLPLNLSSDTYQHKLRLKEERI